MRFDQISPPLSEYPQRAAQAAIARGEFTDLQPIGDGRQPAQWCVHCGHGYAPTKLKRQWVHHEPATGRIIVCTAHDLKPSGS